MCGLTISVQGHRAGGSCEQTLWAGALAAISLPSRCEVAASSEVVGLDLTPQVPRRAGKEEDVDLVGRRVRVGVRVRDRDRGRGRDRDRVGFEEEDVD